MQINLSKHLLINYIFPFFLIEPAGSSPEGATAGQSQLNADAADQAVEAKKSANQPASNVGGSKIKSSKVISVSINFQIF